MTRKSKNEGEEEEDVQNGKRWSRKFWLKSVTNVIIFIIIFFFLHLL